MQYYPGALNALVFSLASPPTFNQTTRSTAVRGSKTRRKMALRGWRRLQSQPSTATFQFSNSRSTLKTTRTPSLAIATSSCSNPRLRWPASAQCPCTRSQHISTTAGSRPSQRCQRECRLAPPSASRLSKFSQCPTSPPSPELPTRTTASTTMR